MGRHEDQVAPIAFGGSDDRLEWHFTDNRIALGRNPRSFCSGFCLGQNLVGFSCSCPTELFGCRWVEKCAFTVNRCREIRLSIEEGNRGSGVLGELNGTCNSGRGESRAVGRNENILEHGVTPAAG